MKPLAQILLLSVSLVALTGCQSLMPQWRIFQKKVPEPIVKSADQVEAERQAADLIARTVETPPQLKTVAQGLSVSLGTPKSPLKGEKPDELDDSEARMAKEWHKVLLKQQEDLKKLNELLAKDEGKKIEGTGVNVFGFSVGFAGLALIALLVAFPPLATILWAIFSRVSGALTATAKGISEFVKEHPEAGEKLKEKLSKTQDAVHKQVIGKIKAKL